MVTKLYDEVNEYDDELKRTVWFEFPYSLEDKTVKELAECVREELDDGVYRERENISESHFIFYSNQIHMDAMEDEVRFSIYIRFLKGNNIPDLNMNMSDYMFATVYDDLVDFSDDLLDYILKDR